MVSESHEIDELLEELRSQLGAPDVVTALRECARYAAISLRYPRSSTNTCPEKIRTPVRTSWRWGC